MPEPVMTIPNPSGQGRPIVSEEQFSIWLEQMRPFLELACSLWAAVCKSGNESHYTVIREKYNLGDWFARKVDAYRSSVAEKANEAEARIVLGVLDKVKKELPVSREELDMLKHWNEKHRTAQPFFVTRTETSEAKEEDLGKVLDTIEAKTDYGKLGQEIGEQSVEANAPVQNQEQTG